VEPTWGVVLPVKRLTAAKSRLRGALTGVPHERLALAIAQDTLAATLASAEVAEVLAVTDDPVVGRALAALGARVVPDVPGGGLNAAFAYGAGLLAHRPVAALAADLPALCPEDLSEALRKAAGLHRHFVADAPGTGTVLLTAPAGVRLDPRFGPGSAVAHRRSGAAPLDGDWPTLRRDVDTAADLQGAIRLGLGRHSAELAGTPSRSVGCSSS
jgi:2-phospho-L-lactate guanylyltransferase